MKIKATYSIFVVVLAVVAITLVGYYYINKDTSPTNTLSESADNPDPAQPDPNPTLSEDGIPIATTITQNNDGTNTLSSPVLGVAFEYPEDWGTDVEYDFERGNCPDDWTKDNCLQIRVSFPDKTLERGSGRLVFETPGRNEYPPGRGAFWGDTSGTPILADIIKDCVLAGEPSSCEAQQNQNGVWQLVQLERDIYDTQIQWLIRIPLPHTQYENVAMLEVPPRDLSREELDYSTTGHAVITSSLRFIDETGEEINPEKYYIL